MRFMTLAEMLSELRAEAGISQNVAHGVSSLEPQKALIRRTQEDLYLAYDWPHLKTQTTKSVSAGARYLELPSTFDFTSVENIWGRDESGDWQALGYGIEPEHYNDYSSDANERTFPIRRWQTYLQPTGDVSTRMFEIWPLPDRATELLVRGKRALLPLTADDQTSTLDGPLIVLFAAGELLARQKSEDAALKIQKGMDRLKWLKARQTAPDTRQANMAGGGAARSLRPGIDYMPRR